MIKLILFCLGTACLSLFLEMCMQEGMVLHSYYKAIEKFPVALFKPLGGCVYCFGTWVFICTYLMWGKSVLTGNFSILTLYCLFGIGFNYVFIKVIERLYE